MFGLPVTIVERIARLDACVERSLAVRYIALALASFETRVSVQRLCLEGYGDDIVGFFGFSMFDSRGASGRG